MAKEREKPPEGFVDFEDYILERSTKESDIELEGDELLEATIKELDKIDHQIVYESIKPLIKLIRDEQEN